MAALGEMVCVGNVSVCDSREAAMLLKQNANRTRSGIVADPRVSFPRQFVSRAILSAVAGQRIVVLYWDHAQLLERFFDDVNIREIPCVRLKAYVVEVWFADLRVFGCFPIWAPYPLWNPGSCLQMD